MSCSETMQVWVRGLGVALLGSLAVFGLVYAVVAGKGWMAMLTGMMAGVLWDQVVSRTLHYELCELLDLCPFDHHPPIKILTALVPPVLYLLTFSTILSAVLIGRVLPILSGGLEAITVPWSWITPSGLAWPVAAAFGLVNFFLIGAASAWGARGFKSEVAVFRAAPEHTEKRVEETDGFSVPTGPLMRISVKLIIGIGFYELMCRWLGEQTGSFVAICVISILLAYSITKDKWF